jgi:hypothetical protein
MIFRMKDERGETEGRNREERQREIQSEKTDGVTEGRDRRRNGGKETKGKRQRGEIEGGKSYVRDLTNNMSLLYCTMGTG